MQNSISVMITPQKNDQIFSFSVNSIACFGFRLSVNISIMFFVEWFRYSNIVITSIIICLVFFWFIRSFSTFTFMTSKAKQNYFADAIDPISCFFCFCLFLITIFQLKTIEQTIGRFKIFQFFFCFWCSTIDHVSMVYFMLVVAKKQIETKTIDMSLDFRYKYIVIDSNQL